MLFKHNRRYCNILKDGMDVALSFPRCITWNTRGLVGSVFSRQKNRELKLKYLKRLFHANNILCLQEVHGKDEYLQAIQVLAPRFLFFGTFIPDKENARGSAICIHRDLLPEGAIVSHVITRQVRDHLVNIQSGRHNLVIINVHFEPELTLRQLRGRLGLIGLHIPVGWALFWVTSTSVIQKKDDVMSGTSLLPMATRERLLCSILSFHTSLRLPNLITREGTPQPLVSYVLFQGLFVFLSIYSWLKHQISIVTLMSLRNLGKQTIPSDHAAVRLVIQKPTNRGHQSKRIPSWMSKRPIFGSILQRLHDDHRFSTDPFCALAEFKVLLHKAKKMTRRELSRQTPDCIGAKLLIACIALRACRNRHLGTLMRCCEAWKLVEDCFDTSSFECIDFQRLSQIIASLTREMKTLKNVRLRSHTSLGRKQKKTLRRCRSGERAWRNKKPVLSLSAVTDEEGHPLENEDETGRRLCDYWGTIF